MASNTTVTVTDVPTVLYEALGPQQETVMIDNTGAGTITIGGKGVTAGAGPQVASSSQPMTLQINEDTIYAVCPSGQTATVEVAAWISGPNT